MSASPRARRSGLALAAAVLAASLVLAALARAQGAPTPGGTVPSTLALSLSEPSPFRRIGHSDLYIAAIGARLTATDVPTNLSLADGEATAGRRLGHLSAGSSILSPALEASAGGGPFRSLDPAVPAALRVWREPLADTPVKIRLRQAAPTARALRSHRKLLLVTLTAGGP
jgi:hypothetical protein